MNATPAEIASYLHILKATPLRIADAMEGRPPAELQAKPEGESWSANDILAHLRACVDVWGKEIRLMLNEETPKFRHLSPRTWMRKTNYDQLPFHESFATFCQERQELLELLQNLPFEDWSRSALVIQGDKERQQTVFSRVRQMAMHEEGHCEQTEALLKAES